MNINFSNSILKTVDVETVVDKIGSLDYEQSGSLRQITKLINQLSSLSEKNQEIARQKLNDLTQKQNSGESIGLLYSLINNRYRKAAKILISLGVDDIHSKNDSSKETPLHAAATRGLCDLVETLINQGASLNETNVQELFKSAPADHQMTPLAACVDQMTNEEFILKHPKKRKEYWDTFQLLLNRGADPKIGRIGICREPLLGWCLFNRKLDLAHALLPKSNVNSAAATSGMTPLHRTAQIGNSKWIKKILDKGANPNPLADQDMWSTRQVTPLHLAIRGGHLMAVKALLEGGADPNVQAVNTRYNRTNVAEWQSQPPFTSYEYAVELLGKKEGDPSKLTAIIQTILEHTQGTAKLLSTHTYSPLEGESFNLRLIAQREMTKWKAPLSGMPNHIRVFSDSHDQSAIVHIKTGINAYLFGKGTLLASREIFNPLLQFLQRKMSSSGQGGIYFVKDVKASGCYDPYSPGDLYIKLSQIHTAFDTAKNILHETAHMAVHRIYGNVSATPTEESFKQAWKKDMQSLNSCHKIIKKLYEPVQRLYEKNDWGSEYFARFAQAALEINLNNPNMTQEDLLEILQTDLPNLTRFYFEEFLPKLKSKT